MPKVIIYTTGICPYCTRAKQLLQRKDIAFDEIRIDTDQEQMRIMLERSRRHTVPKSLFTIIGVTRPEKPT